MGLKFSVYHGSRTPNLGPVVFGFQVKMLCTTEELRQSVNQGSREWVEEMELRVFAARGLQGRLGGTKPSEHLGRVCVLQPEPCSCLPPGLQGQNARHQLWTCLPPTEESLCSLPALLCQGEPESPWPWVLCPREAVTVSHPRVPLKRAFTRGGSVLVSTARTRPQDFQGPGPTGRTWASGCLGWGCAGSPHPRKNPGSRLQKEYHPKVTFAVGLSSWQSLPLPSVQNQPLWGGWALLPGAALPYCPRPLAEFGSSVWSAKATAVQAGAVRIKCSEGPGVQETRKCVVSVCSKGTIACS